MIAYGKVAIKKIYDSTCLDYAVKRADSWLVVSGVKVQADCERLASPHNQTIRTVEVSGMVHVVELTLQVPVINVQSLKEELKGDTALVKRCL